MTDTPSSSYIDIIRGDEPKFTSLPGQSAVANMIIKNVSGDHICLKITADRAKDYRIFPDTWISEPGQECGILILRKCMPDVKDGQDLSAYLDVQAVKLDNACVKREQVWSNPPADIQSVRVKMRFERSRNGKQPKRSRFLSALVKMKWVVVVFVVLASIGLILCLVNCVSQLHMCKTMSTLKGSVM